MKISINSVPEGAIVRNQNFDKIGKSPFEIDKEDYLGQKIFINYDGIIKEFVINENTNFIEESFRKTSIQNEEEVYTNDSSTIDSLNPNTPSSNNKLYMIGGVVALLFLLGAGYWFLKSDKKEQPISVSQEQIQDSISTQPMENSVEFPDQNETKTEAKKKEVKTPEFAKKVEIEKPIVVNEAPVKKEVSFSEDQAKAILQKSISFENNKNGNGLSDLFSSKISRYKTKNNLSKSQLKSIYNDWWSSITYEEKEISSINKIADNTYKVKINHNYQVDGGSEKNVIYYGIYKFDKNGKITELYID
ncbi:MAG: hypothetical protein RR447_00415 [Algoriella sp.]